MTHPDIREWQARVDATIAAYNNPSHVQLEALCEALRDMTSTHSQREAVIAHAHDAQETYRRWLVAEGDRYSAILIGWPPGHRSAIHDHDGLWGIELVLHGTLKVEEYMVEQGTAKPAGRIELGAGKGTVFDHAGYAHACSNPSTSDPTLSLHIYGGPLVQYTAYPDEGAPDEQPRTISTTLERQ